MTTTRGIELDLEKSNFIFTCNGLKLYFSSELYLNKFATLINEYVDMETKKNKLRYKANINMTPILILSLYKKIEKRGFKVFDTNRNKDVEENESFIVYYKD